MLKLGDFIAFEDTRGKCSSRDAGRFRDWFALPVSNGAQKPTYQFYIKKKILESHQDKLKTRNLNFEKQFGQSHLIHFQLKLA